MSVRTSGRLRRFIPTLAFMFPLAYAAAQSPQSNDTLAAVRAACADDAQKFCSTVQPGGGRIIACLKQNQGQVSDRCKQAVMKAMKQGNGGSSSSSPASPATPEPKPSTAPPPNASSGPSSAAGSGTAAEATATPAPKPSSPGTATKAPSSSSAATGSYLRLKQVKVVAHMDANTDLAALDLLVPSDWDFKGTVGFNSKDGCFSDIYAIEWEATSPDGSMGFRGVPVTGWQYSDDPGVLKNLNDPIRRARGGDGKPCPVAKPVKAEEYFRQKVAPAFAAGTTVVSVEPYPELNEIARLQLGISPKDSSNNTRIDAIRARVEFQKDGKASEAWVTAVVVTRMYPAGRGFFYDCHAIDVTSLRTPQGHLDGNEKLLKAMISSIQPEQKWQAWSNRYIATLYQMEAKKEAAMDQAISAFRQHVADTLNSVVANAERGSYNSAFAFDQNIRGVQTFRDPSTGKTMELSNQFDHAWLNGNNEYVMSDDPNFNPTGVFGGDWNKLQLVRPEP